MSNIEQIAIIVEGSWDWDAVGLFRNKDTNQLFIDSDSGCSCYGPFEDDEGNDRQPVRSLADFDVYMQGNTWIGRDDLWTLRNEAIKALRRKGARD